MDHSPFALFDSHASLVGVAYASVGVLGFICNLTTVLMIATNRVFRLSAYTIMANVALADSIVMLIAGVACGVEVIMSDGRMDRIEVTAPHQAIRHHHHKNESVSVSFPSGRSYISFAFVAAWTAGVVSYAMLGMNRCIAICFYGTKARALNRVSVAIACSVTTWVIGIGTAVVSTLPDLPQVGIRSSMWTISFLQESPHRYIFFFILATPNLVGLTAQWVCSTLVLLKIRQVKKKISRNKLNQNSANRFRKQARLTFQFFYPSILCTISSVVFFLKPYIHQSMSGWQLILLHFIWLCNHTCNPFIYAYFNDRMRLTYRGILACTALRYEIRKRKAARHPFNMHARHNVSRRSNANGIKSARMSARSGARGRDGNFVRNSLQMQSRDFEQLCEFIMRVNPLYDSSEGWRESSDEEEPFQPEYTKDLDTAREITSSRTEGGEPRSIVLDLGRQTVEHWVKFAKKASI